jgi:hypothetical protein
MRRTIPAVFALAIVLPIAHAAAEPNKTQYELQERCGKRAEEAFRQEYGNGIGTTELAPENETVG